MRNDEDRKWLYGKMQSAGVDTGTYDEFVESLNNDEDRDWYYQKSQKMGLDVGSADDFYNMMASPQEITPEPQPEDTTQEEPQPVQEAAPAEEKPVAQANKPVTAAEEGAKLGGLAATANAVKQAQPQEEEVVDVEQKPTPVQKPKQTLQLTEAERRKYDNQMREMQSGVKSVGKKIEKQGAYRQGILANPFDSGQQRIEIGNTESAFDRHNPRVVEKEQYNPETGQYEKTYTNEAGEYKNKELAERDQEQIDRARYQETHPEYKEQATRTQVANMDRDLDDELRAAQEESANMVAEYVKDANPIALGLTINAGGMGGYLGTETVKLENIPTEEAQELAQRIRELEAARTYMRDAKRTIAEADKAVKENKYDGWLKQWTIDFAKGAARGFGEKLFDIDTWDSGLTDLQNNSALLLALDKADAGEELTYSQRALLDAKAMELAVQAYFGSYVGRGYKAGQVTAESIPFMLEMCLNPASRTGETAANKLARYALKRFAKRAGVEGAEEMAERGLTRAAIEAAGKNAVARAIKPAAVAGRIIGDVAGAAAMAGTTGAVGVAADTENRMAGNVRFKTDEEGRNEYSHREDAKEFGEAFAKSFGSRTIENYSEMVGEYFAPVLGALGSAAGRGLERVGLGAISRFVDNVSASRIAKAVTDFENQARWNGTIGEFSEEIVGGVLNALFVGDQTLDTDKDTGVFNKDNLIDTFLGVSLMGGVFSGIKTLGYQSQTRRARQNMIEQGNVASSLFNDQEKWGQIRNTIDFGSDEEIEAVLSEVKDDENLTEEQKMAAFRYATYAMHYKGTQMAEEKRRAEQDPVHTDLETSFDNGYELEGQEKNDAKNKYEYERQRIAQITTEEGIAYLDENPLEALDSALHDDDWSEEERQAALDYVNAKATYDGMMRHVEDDIDSQIAESDRLVGERTHRDGMIHPVTLNGDRKVYIVDGRLAQLADGSVDVQNSEPTLIVRGEDGKIEYISPSDIASVDESIDAEEERNTAAQAIRESVTQTATAEIEGTLPFNNGDQYNIIDDEGLPHVVTIIDNGEAQDGAITIGGGMMKVSIDGEELDMTRNRIQQWANNANLARLAEHEQHKQQEREEETVQGENNLVAGAPAEYTQGLNIVVRDEDGNETDAVVGGRVRYEDGQFVADENGNMIEYLVGGEVRHDYIDDLNEKVVGYRTTEEETGSEQAVVEASPETTGANEATAATTEEPVAETEPADTDAMPMNGEEPDFLATTPERGHRYLFEESGWDADEAGQFIEANKKAADKALATIQGKKPKMGTSVAKYNTEKAEWQAKVDAAQAAADYWNAVASIEENRANALTSGENVVPLQSEEQSLNADERQAMLDELKNLAAKIATAKQIYGDYFDSDFAVPQDVNELVAMNMPKEKISWEGREGVRGLQQELGSNFTRRIGRRKGSTYAFNQYLAKKGEGISTDKAIHDIWESPMNELPNGEKRWDSEEIRAAFIDMFMNAVEPTDIRDYVYNSRIRQAEQMKRAEEEAAEIAQMDEDIRQRTGMEREEYDAWIADMTARAEAQAAYETETYNETNISDDRRTEESTGTEGTGEVQGQEGVGIGTEEDNPASVGRYGTGEGTGRGQGDLAQAEIESQEREESAEAEEKTLPESEENTEKGLQNQEENATFVLTLENLEASDLDEAVKSGARAWLNGDKSPANQLSFLAAQDYVRDFNERTERSGSNADGAQLGSEDNGVANGENGRGNGEGGFVDTENDAEGVSADRAGRTDSAPDVASSDGERGDRGVSSEESADGNGSAVSDTTRGRNGRSNRSNGKRRGRGSSSTISSRDAGGNTIADAKAELDEALKDFEDILKESFTEPAKGKLLAADPVSLYTYLGAVKAIKLITAGSKVAYAAAKLGYYEFKEWFDVMKAKLGALLRDYAGMDDEQIDGFIEMMWDYDITVDGETRKVREWASMLSDAKLREQMSLTIEEKRKLQAEAESTPTTIADITNIRESLPFLLPKQQEDVQKAERQFFTEEHADAKHGHGKGYMFTNGTGTGKTYTGLGIVKRFIKQGKKRILIVTAQETKINDWIRDAKNLGIEATMLPDTKTKGSGVVVTQYANMRQNRALLEDEFDLIVYDESHKLMENQDGTTTSASIAHHMLSNRDERQAARRVIMGGEFGKRYYEAKDELELLVKALSTPTTEWTDEIRDAVYGKYGKSGLAMLDGRVTELRDFIEKFEERLEEEVDNYLSDSENAAKAREAAAKTKVVFLSATPFNTPANLDYTEGYIFSYSNKDEVEKEADRLKRRDSFLIDKFNASHQRNAKTNTVTRITQERISDPLKASEEEVAFSDYMQNDLETMSGRDLDSEYDYSREFPKLDFEMADLFNDAIQSLSDGRFNALADYFDHLLNDYNTMTAYLEIFKAQMIAPRIKEYIDLGKKVTLFHRRKASNVDIFPPFALAMQKAREAAKEDNTLEDAVEAFEYTYRKLFQWEGSIDYMFPQESILNEFMTDKEKADHAKAVRKWSEENNETLQTLVGELMLLNAKIEDADSDELSKIKKEIKEKNAAVDKIMKARPKPKCALVSVFNGSESAKDRADAVADFNNDNGKTKVLVVQVQSGKEGISLHDTTGKFPRVQLGIFLPQSPIEFIQTEGRIFRVGNKSNAIFEYPLLGLDIELSNFALKINGRSETTENLALGSRGRGLKESISRSALASRHINPADAKGVGGKELDNRKAQQADGFSVAVKNYDEWRNEEKPVDANDIEIPDPIGYMMSKWGYIENGERVLTPNARRGSIARYIPTRSRLTAMEQRNKDYARLSALIGGSGRKVLNEGFEGHSLNNKYDIVVMNTDHSVTEGRNMFGVTSTATDVTDVNKAFKHLEDSGRVIALVVGNRAGEIMSSLKQQYSDAVPVAEIKLPAFVLGGTQSSIVVIDKIDNKELKAQAGEQQTIDLSGAADEDALFAQIRDVVVPERHIDKVGKVSRRVRGMATAFINAGTLKKEKNWRTGKMEPVFYTDYGYLNAQFAKGKMVHFSTTRHVYSNFYIEFKRIAANDMEYISTLANEWVYMMNQLGMSDEELYDKYRHYIDYKEDRLGGVRDSLRAMAQTIELALDKTPMQLRNIAAGKVENEVSGSYTLEGFIEVFKSLNADNAELEALAEKVFSAASQIEGLQFKVLDGDAFKSRGGHNVAAHYVPSRNIIELNGDVFNSIRIPDSFKAQTTVHETIHALTCWAIRAYKDESMRSRLTPTQQEACKTIMDVYSQINNDDFRNRLRLSSNMEDNAEYGLTNEEEMMAELANPVFRAALKAKNLWRQIVNGIKMLLGIEIPGVEAEKTDALTALDNALDTLLNTYDANLYAQYTQGDYRSTFPMQMPSAMNDIEEIQMRWEALAKKYKGKPYNVVTSIDEMDDEEFLRSIGVTEEEISAMTAEEIRDNAEIDKKYAKGKKLGGGYSPMTDKIVIFAENISSPNKIEEAFFHENLHGVLFDVYGEAPQTIAEHFWDAVEEGLMTKEEVAEGYGGQSDYVQKVEYFVYNISKAMVSGRVSELLGKMSADDTERIDNILNALGYDRRAEETRRAEEASRRAEGQVQDILQEDLGANDAGLLLENTGTEGIFEAAKRHFGITNDIREAGYVLPDGTMLDFSGRHQGADEDTASGQRHTDHREVVALAYTYNEEGEEVETGIRTDMSDFIERGAIRIDDNAGFINLSTKPTAEQRNVLRRLIARNGGDVQVDFGNGWDSENYVEYDEARAARVLADIDKYYDEGIVPTGDSQERRLHRGGSQALGVPYQGSKSRIASSIINDLPAGDRFVDLFSGGGAMTHAAINSRKYGTFHMNDINPKGQELFMQGVRGDWRGYDRTDMTEEEFEAIKGTPESLVWSFNGLGRTLAKNDGRNRVAEQVRRVQRLEELKPYEETIETSANDYKNVTLKQGDVVYADIPYENTDQSGYGNGKFNKQEFIEWAQAQDVPVFVSEYSMPEGWTEISSYNVQGMRGGTRKEKLFVQDKFADYAKIDRLHRMPTFYSNAERAVEGIKQEKATPEQWLAMITKAGGLKAGEDKWMGLSDWLKSQDKKSLTKQEVMDFIKGNRVEVEDVHYSEVSDVDYNPKMKELRLEFDELVQEGSSATNSIFISDWADWALNEMVDRYGDDFRDSFAWDKDSNGYPQLMPSTDWDGTLTGQARYYLDINDNPINGTRLEYTTSGLDNKHEIALVVPSIESWNESDDIHFGDAGEGRAIAWIRFGETEIPDSEAYNKALDANKKRLDFMDKMMDKYNEDTWNPTQEKMSPEERNEMSNLNIEAMNARTASRNSKQKRVLVIDEIQSNRHQEGREKGYKGNKTDFDNLVNARSVARIATKAEDSYINTLRKKYGTAAFLPLATEEERSHYETLVKSRKEARQRELELEQKYNINGVPDAPFDKNWHELAMKRMLRYAAENGYDKIAWTKGEQQAKRYNIGNVVDKIISYDYPSTADKEGRSTKKIEVRLKDGETMTMRVNDEGMVIEGRSDTYGKNLSEIVGKDLASSIMRGEGREGNIYDADRDLPAKIIDGEGLRIGAEGMAGFYDQILPRFMDKYGKKWGVKTEEVELPNVEEAGRTMWSVDVTPEMKESVMQGQPMFRDGLGQITYEESLAASKAAGYTKKQHDAWWNRTQKNMRHTAEDMAEKMHISDIVTIVERADELEDFDSLTEEDKQSKGWFDPKTGKIVVILGNHAGAHDVLQTMLHEGVNHYGLRKMFGKHFETFLKNVYNNASPEIRNEINKLMSRNGWNYETATEEYLGKLAEDTDFENAEKSGWWHQIKEWFLDMLRSVGLDRFFAPYYDSLSDNELRYILWRSYQNLVNPNRYRSLVDTAIDIAKQFELGVGKFAAKIAGEERVAERVGETAVTPEEDEAYNRAVENNNMDAAQRMVDEAAEKAGYTIRAYHGNKFGDRFTEYNGGFFTSDRKVAESYDVNNIGVYDTFLKMENPIVINNPYAWNQIWLTREEAERYGITETSSLYIDDQAMLDAIEDMNESTGVDWIVTTTDDLVEAMQNSDGYDGVVINGMYGDMFDGSPSEGAHNEYIPKNASQVKSAEPVTYNNNGEVIPLSERFNSRNNDIRYRKGGKLHRDGDFTPRDKAIARDEYERIVSSGSYQFREAVQDSMLGLRRAMESIDKVTRIEDVPDSENAYTAENAMSSANSAQQSNFFREYMMPLLNAIHDIAGDSAEKREELIDYMMAKHGLERNEKFAARDAQAEADATDGDYDALYERNRKKDYSGLTALTGASTTFLAEKLARDKVEAYEAQHDTTDLWAAVNNATKTTLAKIRLGGLLSQERYEQIRDQFEYYIPLQGWDETTSDEVYGYLTSKDSPLMGGTIKHAYGRMSKADDPIATIAMMADKAIMQANRNDMKQRFLTFVENHPSDLVSVNKLWLQYDEAADEWKPVFADIESGDTPRDVERKVKAFEERMEQLAEAEPEKYKHGKDAVNIPYKVVKGNLREHQVLVKRDGETFVLTINGNPRAAQALNGITNPDVEAGGAVGNMLKLAENINHQLSAFYTTRTPDFVISNFFRDMLYSNCMTWVKESPSYALTFHKNFGRVNPAMMGVLFNKWESGTLDESNELERQFKTFLLNGGETGYTNVRDIEAHKKAIAEELKRMSSTPRKAWRALGLTLDLMNRSVENCARFAAFLTSQEMGRSIGRSIYDAKEVSVNFNKKGAGGKMLNSKGQDRNILKLLINPKTYMSEKDRAELLAQTGSYIGGGGRLLFVFWNAGVQGMTNFGRAAKKNPKKFAAGAATLYALGTIMPLVAMAVGGDDDDYYDLPEYVRRSNICFRLSKDMPWITIPLPIEFRALYGLGELATGVITGKEHYSDGELAHNLISQVSQILPLDFMEGGGGGHAFIPSVAKPLVEAASNKSWTGLPIYKDTPYNQNDPEYTKVYKNADKYIVGASKWLNEFTGGDEHKKGWADVVNPSQIEYMLNGYFGGFFKVPNQLVKMAETAFGDREFDWRNMMLANRLLKNGDETTQDRKLRNAFFRYKEEYEETKRLLNDYNKAVENGELKYVAISNDLKNSEAYQRYIIFDEYRGIADALNDAANEATDEERKASLLSAYYDVLDDMVKDIESLNPKAGEHVDSLSEMAFNDSYGTNLRKKIGSDIARRLGGKDSYGSPDTNYGVLYEKSRDYVDIAADVTLQVMKREAKESGNVRLEKGLDKYQRKITELKNKLTGLHPDDDEVMERIRSLRQKALDWADENKNNSEK